MQKERRSWDAEWADLKKMICFLYLVLFWLLGNAFLFVFLVSKYRNLEICMTLECLDCHGDHEIKVDLEGLHAWLYEKKMLQDALPYLNTQEQLLMISGKCERCLLPRKYHKSDSKGLNNE